MSDPYQAARKKRLNRVNGARMTQDGRGLKQDGAGVSSPQQQSRVQPSSNVRIGSGSSRSLGGTTRGRATFGGRKQAQPAQRQGAPDWYQAQQGQVAGASAPPQGGNTGGTFQQAPPLDVGGDRFQAPQAGGGGVSWLQPGLAGGGDRLAPPPSEGVYTDPLLDEDREDYSDLQDYLGGLDEGMAGADPVPGFDEWAAGQFGGPRDTAEDEALLLEMAQGALGQDLVNARAGYAAGGFGASGALGARENQLIQQAGLAAGRDFLDVRAGARAEDLARAGTAAELQQGERRTDILEDQAETARMMLEDYLGEDDLDGGGGGGPGEDWTLDMDGDGLISAADLVGAGLGQAVGGAAQLGEALGAMEVPTPDDLPEGSVPAPEYNAENVPPAGYVWYRSPDGEHYLVRPTE